MPKGRAQDRSRRAFLRRAGGLTAALVAAPQADGAQAPRLAAEARDRGLWITWYDLPEAGRSEYLSWLHDTHIPALLKRPGVLWAAHYASIPDNTAARVTHTDDSAVPTGNAYILVVGAEDSNVFGRPTPAEWHAAQPEAGKKMIAMRIGERTNIFAEAARVDGPDAKSYKEGMVLAPCIQLGTQIIDYQKEVDILAWYAQLQMPNMALRQGSVRTRKLASVFGWAKMGILYEYGSVESRNRAQGGGGGGKNPWGNSVQALIHAPGSPNVARRIWPPIQM